MSEGENRETHNVETVPQTGTHVVDEKGVRTRHGGSAPGRLVPAMTDDIATIRAGLLPGGSRAAALARVEARLAAAEARVNTLTAALQTVKGIADSGRGWPRLAEIWTIAREAGS